MLRDGRLHLSGIAMLAPLLTRGDHSPGNIRLLCKSHNRYLAERDYGHATINRHRRLEKEARC